MNPNLKYNLRDILLAILVLVLDIWLYQFNLGIFVSFSLVLVCSLMTSIKLSYFKVGLISGLSILWGLVFWQNLATMLLLAIIYLLLRTILDRFITTSGEILAVCITFLGGSLLFVNFSVFIIIISVGINLSLYIVFRRVINSEEQKSIISFL